MKVKLGRQLVIALVCGLWTAGVVALYGVGFRPLHDMEGLLGDWRMRLGRKTKPDPNLILIGIDRASYASDIDDKEAEVKPALQHLKSTFPWSREVWAELVEQLVNAGAKAVVLTMQFPGPGNGDEALARVLQKHSEQVVIGSDFSQVDDAQGGNSLQLSLPSPTLLRFHDGAAFAAESRVGYLNIWADMDDVVRRTDFRIPPEETKEMIGAELPMESFAAKALRQFGKPDLIPNGYDSARFRYTGLPGQGYKSHRLLQVLSPESWQVNYGKGEFFRGKLVVVGGVANILPGRHRTPLGFPDMSGAELQMNIIGAALNGEFLDETGFITNLAIIGLAGMLAGFLCLKMTQPTLRLGIIAAGVVFYLGAGQLLFDYGNLVVLGVSPVLPPLLTGISALGYDFVLEKLERLKLRTAMGRYFSPRVLQDVLANPGSMQPRRAEATLLLTDLRNSTPLAELLSVDRMFELLNKVFEVETAAVMDQEGNLEHFLGDQFLSYWGAPQEQPDAAERAWHAACALIISMEQLKKNLEADVQKLFGYGVGLHRGPVLIGNKGSARHLDYGLVGDTVSTAARVESLTKLYGVLCLMTPEVFRHLKYDGPKRLVDRVLVEGKQVPVELLEPQHPASRANFAELCRAYETVYADYFNGKFDVARRGFSELAHQFADTPSRLLSERCQALIENPPRNWQGIWRARK